NPTMARTASRCWPPRRKARRAVGGPGRIVCVALLLMVIATTARAQAIEPEAASAHGRTVDSVVAEPLFARIDDVRNVRGDAFRPIAAAHMELLAVRLNAIDQPDEVLALRLASGRLALPVEALTALRLRLPAEGRIEVEGRAHVDLDRLGGVEWAVDPGAQRLALIAAAAAFVNGDVTLSAGARPEVTPASRGGFVNYDWNVEHERRSDGLRGSTRVGALLEAGVFGASGNGRASFLASGGSGASRLTRLDTTWTVDRTDSLTSLRIGDGIGVSGLWGRSVRFGGVAWGTNFALDPSLARFPLPALRGEAVLPSSIDVYVNNAQQLHANVPAGAFDLASVPVVTGQGQIRMVVRDLLGREQVVSQAYYASPALLQPGLRDFAIEAGFVRRDYGFESARYGGAVVNLTDRLGITPSFTREWRAELATQRQTIGAGGLWVLAQAVSAELSGAASRSPSGTGWLVQTGLERQSSSWSANVKARTESRDFAQLGGRSELAPASRATLSMALSAPVAGGGAGVSALQQTRWDGLRFRTATLSYSRGLGPLTSLGVYATRVGGAGAGSSIGLSLVRVLGDRESASAGVTHERRVRHESSALSERAEQTQGVLQWQRTPPADQGLGVRLQAQRGGFDRAEAEVLWRLPTLDATAAVAHAGRADGVRIGAAGALAWMPEGVFASRRIDGSFAVVRVAEYGGVQVLRDNQPVGRTDAQGRILVPNLRAHESNLIGVEAADLPLDAQIDRLQMAVAPATRSGVSIAFPVRSVRMTTLVLVTDDGKPVAPGRWVTVQPEGRRFPVGFDGKVFLSGVSGQATLVADRGDPPCRIEIDLTTVAASSSGDAADLGTRVCR
ncbi:MAG: fimbria/pilus outer membrane usher protein, partial [Caldimonas sp.]